MSVKMCICRYGEVFCQKIFIITFFKAEDFTVFLQLFLAAVTQVITGADVVMRQAITCFADILQQ